MHPLAHLSRQPLTLHFPLAAAPIAALLLVGSGLAGAATAGSTTASSDDTLVEGKPLLEITVTASPLGRTADELVQPVSVLAGEELQSRKRGTLGQTLEQEPGISTTDFGMGAGRPVIRGQAGPRVEVLSNGVSAMDVSDLSPDHAVTINPLQAQQIEVIKGPATLLYGSSAVGGVVNVNDNRLALDVTPGFSGQIEGQAGSNAGERGLAGDFNYGSGPHQLHADINHSSSDDYRIPGTAGSDGSGSRGRLANSATELDSGAVSYSHINDNGDAYGLALSQYDSRYGLPVEPAAFIDMHQTRVDAQALLRNPTDNLESLRLRVGNSHYRHTEYEDAATPGTRFHNDQSQARVEAVHKAVAGFRGVIGMQGGYRDFSALGDEAYVPPVQSRQVGVFMVEEKPLPFGKLELGARLEDDNHAPDGGQPSRRFRPFSYSAGGIVNLGADTHFKATASHAERTPAAEELYANGPHGATATFEQGSNTLRKERANDVEIGLDHHQGRVTLEGSLFYKRVKDYIYTSEVDSDSNGSADRVDASGTPDPAGDFLLVNYRQADAVFHGYEAAASYAVLDSGPMQLSTRVFSDSVRGQLDSDAGASGRSLPRMTPTRYGVSLHGHYQRLSGNLSFTRVSDQDRIASLETRTNGYNLLNADVSYRLPISREASLFLRANNLLDDDIRRATSFVKDEAPAPGRGFVAGFRVAF